MTHRQSVIDALGRYFVGRADVDAAWLFGSVARDDAGPNSDVDVAVLLTAGVPKNVDQFGAVTDLQDELQALLGRPVDVVVADGAAPDLLMRVRRDGVLVHERDHRRRVLFEVRSRNEYWDLLPILQRYRRTVLKGC